jgi:hypothetical protein
MHSVTETTKASCNVGERPAYFVPKDEDSPLALIGCARLGVSGKRLEFNASLDRFRGDWDLCIDPAYGERGQKGGYIPGICGLDPLPTRFRVDSVEHPRQAGRGYGLVIWGTGGVSTATVHARFRDGVARAAVFRVRRELARRFGQRPFSLFVLELPLGAACAPIKLARNGSRATKRIPARPRVCERA